MRIIRRKASNYRRLSLVLQTQTTHTTKNCRGHKAIPREMLVLETDRDKEEATAEVKKGMKNPWQNLKLIKAPVRGASTSSAMIKEMAAVERAGQPFLGGL